MDNTQHRTARPVPALPLHALNTAKFQQETRNPLKAAISALLNSGEMLTDSSSEETLRRRLHAFLSLQERDSASLYQLRDTLNSAAVRSSLLAQAQDCLGQELMAVGDATLAIGCFQEAATAAADSSSARFSPYFHLCNGYAVLGKLKSAVRYGTQAALYAEDADADEECSSQTIALYSLLAKCEEGLKRFDRAKYWLKVALRSATGRSSSKPSSIPVTPSSTELFHSRKSMGHLRTSSVRTLRSHPLSSVRLKQRCSFGEKADEVTFSTALLGKGEGTPSPGKLLKLEKHVQFAGKKDAGTVGDNSVKASNRTHRRSMSSRLGQCTDLHSTTTIVLGQETRQFGPLCFKVSYASDTELRLIEITAVGDGMKLIRSVVNDFRLATVPVLAAYVRQVLSPQLLISRGQLVFKQQEASCGLHRAESCPVNCAVVEDFQELRHWSECEIAPSISATLSVLRSSTAWTVHAITGKCRCELALSPAEVLAACGEGDDREVAKHLVDRLTLTDGVLGISAESGRGGVTLCITEAETGTPVYTRYYPRASPRQQSA